MTIIQYGSGQSLEMVRNQTLVIATHGFVKKQWKVPENEINKAIKIRKAYFENPLSRK